MGFFIVILSGIMMMGLYVVKREFQQSDLIFQELDSNDID